MSLYQSYKQQNAIIRIAIFTYLVKVIALSQYYLSDDAVGDVALSLINSLLYNFVFSGMIFSSLLLLWHLLAPVKELFNFSAFLYTFFTILISLADLFIIRFTGMRFSPSIIKTYGVGYIASPDVLLTLLDNPVLSGVTILIAIGIILMFVFYKKIMSNHDIVKFKVRTVGISSIVFILGWLLVSNLNSSYYLSARPAEVAFLKTSSYQGKTATKFNEEEKLEMNEILENYLDRKIQNPSYPLMQSFSSDTSINIDVYPDIFFIMIESLRGLELSFINDKDPAYTPVIDSLVKTGVTFTKFMSNGYPTDDGMFPAHTSVLPHYNRKNVRDNINTRYSTIPKLLHGIGYKTGTFSAVKPFGPMLDWFEKWYEDVDYQCESGHCNEYETFEKAKLWVNKQDSLPAKKPLFYYIHTNDLHHPFYTRFTIDKDSVGNSSYRNEQPKKEGDLRKRYKKTLESTDFAMGEFLKFLAQRDKKNNTLIVFLGDHGKEAEEVFQRGTRLYPMNAMMLTGAIISGPEKLIGMPRIVNYPTSSVDVLPTLISSLNLKKEIATWGRNMLSSQGNKTSINVRPGGLRYNWGDSSLFINSYNPNDYWVTTFGNGTNDKSEYRSPVYEQKAKEIYDLVQYGSYLIEEDKLIVK